LKIKLFKPLTTILFLALLFIVTGSAAFCADENPVNDFTEGVRNTLDGQAAANQNNLVPALVVTIVLLVVIIFLLRSQVKSIRSREKVWNIDLNNPAGGQDSQRRAWLRLPVNQFFLYAQDDSNLYEKTKAINISGGGLLFATDERPELKEKLKININVAPGKTLTLNGQVAWISENHEDNRDSRYMVGIEFIGIKPGEQDSIVGRILQEQQQMVIEERRKANNECVKCGLPLTAKDKEQAGNSSVCARCTEPVIKIKGDS
jgi:Tfp pilus assembly protein PilZ/type IV secretory pathway VirB2 component (pilin)